MANDSFTLKIFTPSGLELEAEVVSVNLPSSDGEIGILPGHAKYVGLLGIGILEYVEARTSQPRRVVVSGGFCNFTNDVLTLLADSVDFSDRVNREEYAVDRGALTKLLQEIGADEPKAIQARQSLARMEAIDRLIGTH